jgi:hypothetical protein
MRSIWYFVGLMLLIIGSVIVLAGLVSLVTGAERHTVLANIYPELWWGGLILIAGSVFFVIGLKTDGDV